MQIIFVFNIFEGIQLANDIKYNITLESNIFTLKQYYMILEKCIFIFFFLLFKELNWQMTLKQYNMILEK